jgi:lysophospholipase L1-like esterase
MVFTLATMTGLPAGARSAQSNSQTGSHAAAKSTNGHNITPGPAVAGLPHVSSRLRSSVSLRIVAFGSSSTEGTGASNPAATYPAQLQDELEERLPDRQIIVINRGHAGDDAQDMMQRLPLVLADRPDLVIWQTGTNDPLRHLPLDRFIALTREGITRIRATGADVMLMEPQDCPVYDSTPGAMGYRDAVRALGKELGVPVVRRFDLMRQWVREGIPARELQSGDGLHMGDRGYALLADAVADLLLPGTTGPETASGR